HDQQEALSIADQVAVLLAGRVAQTGEPTELYSAPSSLEVATFVGEAVVLAGVAHGATASCVLGEVGLAAGSPSAGAVDLVIRPEQLVVGAAAAPHGAPAESAGPAGAGGAGGAVGAVVGRSYYGHDGVVRVALPGGDIVTCRMAAGVLPARGAYLCVRANAAVVAFPARA
ncbi:MAG: TOBE domain-containing protein, partial [Actinomycetota bacterium]|nr:TOBE domain-containing protein [Actinomycetota bacterium]